MINHKSCTYSSYGVNQHAKSTQPLFLLLQEMNIDDFILIVEAQFSHPTCKRSYVQKSEQHVNLTSLSGSTSEDTLSDTEMDIQLSGRAIHSSKSSIMLLIGAMDILFWALTMSNLIIHFPPQSAALLSIFQINHKFQ